MGCPYPAMTMPGNGDGAGDGAAGGPWECPRECPWRSLLDRRRWRSLLLLRCLELLRPPPPSPAATGPVAPDPDGALEERDWAEGCSPARPSSRSCCRS
jgi:hypothetical protein